MLETNRLYHMDCMKGMAELPDEFFDLAVVDPPYGVGSVTYMPHTRTRAVNGFIDKYDVTLVTLSAKNQSARHGNRYDVEHGRLTKSAIRGFGDYNTAPPPEYFKELFRVSKHQIIWGGNNFLLPPSRNFIVWDKRQSEDFSMAMAELAWCSMDGVVKIFRGQPMTNAADKDPQNIRIHPVQKPIALYLWILNRYAKQSDRILDTHVGSASSLITCRRAGYEYLGFEIDERYYNAARERLDMEAAQPTVMEMMMKMEPEGEPGSAR